MDPSLLDDADVDKGLPVAVDLSMPYEDEVRAMPARHFLERLGVPVPVEVTRLRASVLRGVDEAASAIAHTPTRQAYRKTVVESTQAEHRYAHIVELDPADGEARMHLAQVKHLRAQGPAVDHGHDDEALLEQIEVEGQGTRHR